VATLMIINATLPNQGGMFLISRHLVE